MVDIVCLRQTIWTPGLPSSGHCHEWGFVAVRGSSANIQQSSSRRDVSHESFSFSSDLGSVNEMVLLCCLAWGQKLELFGLLIYNRLISYASRFPGNERPVS
jgi:hypothetical protein